MGFEFKPRPIRYVPVCNGNRKLPTDEQLWVEFMPWKVGERGIYMIARDKVVRRFNELQDALEKAITDGEDTTPIVEEHATEGAKVLRYRLSKATRVGIGDDSTDDADQMYNAICQDEDLAIEVSRYLEGAGEPKGDEVPT